MGFQMGLDEYTDAQLEQELAQRKAARARGMCCYCGRPQGSSPACRFGYRHRGYISPEAANIGAALGGPVAADLPWGQPGDDTVLEGGVKVGQLFGRKPPQQPPTIPAPIAYLGPNNPVTPPAPHPVPHTADQADVDQMLWHALLADPAEGATANFVAQLAILLHRKGYVTGEELAGALDGNNN